jgi:hypothetical protein
MKHFYAVWVLFGAHLHLLEALFIGFTKKMLQQNKITQQAPQVHEQ